MDITVGGKFINPAAIIDIGLIPRHEPFTISQARFPVGFQCLENIRRFLIIRQVRFDLFDNIIALGKGFCSSCKMQ